MSNFWQSKQQKKRSPRASRQAQSYRHHVQHLECRHMLSGESIVENSPPTVGTPLHDVVVNSGAIPRLLDLTKVFVDADLNDVVSISIVSNSEPGIVTPLLQGEELLLEFSGVVGSSTITLLGTDSQGESISSSFQVIVSDGGSSISATISDVTSIKPVGTVQAELSPPEILNEWESVALEFWYTVGNDTPGEPFDFGIRFQGLANQFETPTTHATLGSQVSLQHDSSDQWHSTFAYISDLDLSAYQLGDKVLIASFIYAPTTGSSSIVATQQEGKLPTLSHETLFQVTEAVFVGTKQGVYDPYVASQMAPVVFDVNNDGRIGISDFAQFISRYGKSSNSNTANHDATASWFDFNRDGRVGLADFALFIGNYGKQRGSSSDFSMPGLTAPVNNVDSVNALPSVEISVTGVVDQVFDDRNQILYVITSAGNLERWSYDGQTLLSRFENVATSPRGFDVTRDGRFAYVGDAFVENNQGTVWKVDLSDGSKTPLVYNLTSLERGVFDLAIASNGKAFFTTSFAGSGWTPLHEIDLATGVITSLANVRQNTGITRGADRSLLFFQEGNISSGPIFTYDANAGTFSAKTNTNRFVGSLPAAVGPRGDAIVFIDVLLNDDLKGDIIGQDVGYAPTFDRSGRFVYSIDIATDEVLVHDARNLQLLRRIPIGSDVSNSVNVAISEDSQHLFITTASGIRQVATTLPGTNPDDLQVPTGEVIRLFPDFLELAPPWLTIHFDEPVTGLTLDDIRLTRDGSNNLLDGNQSLFTIDRGRTWILYGVQSLMTPAGAYTLQVEAAGSGIQDRNGNLLASDFYQVWTRSLDEADDVLVQLEGIRDQVYDETQGILYVTTENGSLQRWDVARQEILSSINSVAVVPSGLDITPDGRYAYVGEGSEAISEGVVWKVDLHTGIKTPIRYTYDGNERGVFDLAISADGKVFFTTKFSGSGWTPLRSIDLGTGAVTTYYQDVRQNTSITRGADRSVLFFQESNISSGPIFTYDANSHAFSDPLDSNRFVGSLPDAVSRDGRRIAFLSSILDSSDLATTTIGISNAAAYAFDPTRDILYVADYQTDEIVAYDPETLGVIGRFAIGEDITGTVGLAINEDASFVFLTSASGVRQIPLAVPEGDVVPPVGTFFEVVPQQRYDAVDSITIEFNEIVVGVTVDDFQLTLNGGEDLLTGSESVVTNDGGLTWVISGLQSSTESLGNYQLELIAAGSGIQDAVGNLLTRNESVAWEVIRREISGSLLPFVDARDSVFDATGGILYVTTPDGKLQRWDVESQTLLDSFENISSNPRGLDITPDGQFAYIGEGTPSATTGIVWKVDLSDGSKTALVYDLAFYEQGVFDLAIASNGKAFFTTSFAGSGWTPLHEIDLATDVITRLPNVRQNTGITRGADRSLLFFQESNISSGPIFTYDANAGTFSTKTNTDAFNGSRPAAVSHDGSMIAFRGAIWDATDLTVTASGIANGAAYAFDTSRDILYVADYVTDEIVAYDPITLWPIDRRPIGEDIPSLVQLSINEDSTILFVQTSNGVRQVEFSIPPGDVVPPYATLVDVLPIERYDGVSSITVQFDEVVTGVSIDDFRLKRNGAGNLLTGDETVTTSDGGITWVIDGLVDLTQQLGSYQLQLVGAGSQIQDQTGNLMQWDFSTSWKVISPNVAGELLPFADVVDHAFDETSGMLYVTTTDGSLHRWDTTTRTLLESWEGIAAVPKGLDISPDGLFAYVGDRVPTEDGVTVWQVDLQNGIKTPLSFELRLQEAGVWDLTVTSTGKLFFTSLVTSNNYGYRRVVDLATGEATFLTSPRHVFRMSRSADGSVVFFAEAGLHSADVVVYHTDTDTYSSPVNYQLLIGNDPSAVSPDGSQVVFVGQLFDSTDMSSGETIFGQNIGGYIFHPTQDILYAVDMSTYEIVAYDLVSQTTRGRFAIGESFQYVMDLSVSAEDSIVYVTTPLGIRAVHAAVPEMTSPASLSLEGEAIGTEEPHASSDPQALAEWFPLAATVVDSVDQGEELEEDTYFVGPPAPLTPNVTDADWQRQLDELNGTVMPADVDQQQYTSAVDDVFDQLEESELELLLD